MERGLVYQEWQKERQKSIGGSEAAAILGYNPYKTAYSVWADKTGRAAPIEDNKYMRAGRLLEPVIVQMFQEETGYPIQGSNEYQLYRHPEFEFITGTPDRVYATPEGPAILECKNTRMHLEEVPLHWWCQLQHYMGLLGMSQGEIAWLEQGVDFHHQQFDFSPEFYAYSINQIVHFWREHVLADIPPPAKGADIDHQFMQHIVGKSVEATESTLELVRKTKLIREKKFKLSEEESNYIDQIKLIMRDGESLEYEGEKLVTWKTNKAHKRIFLIK